MTEDISNNGYKAPYEKESFALYNLISLINFSLNGTRYWVELANWYTFSEVGKRL